MEFNSLGTLHAGYILIRGNYVHYFQLDVSLLHIIRIQCSFNKKNTYILHLYYVSIRQIGTVTPGDFAFKH